MEGGGGVGARHPTAYDAERERLLQGLFDALIKSFLNHIEIMKMIPI